MAMAMNMNIDLGLFLGLDFGQKFQVQDQEIEAEPSGASSKAPKASNFSFLSKIVELWDKLEESESEETDEVLANLKYPSSSSTTVAIPWMNNCGYPTDVQLAEIKEAGGFQRWIMDQEVSDKKYDARNFVGKGATKCTFKPNLLLEKNNAKNIDRPDQEDKDTETSDEELDIIGLDEEEKETSEVSHSKSDEEEKETSEVSHSESGTSSSSASDRSYSSSGDEYEGSRRESPLKKKKTCREIVQEIYARRGESEPST